MSDWLASPQMIDHYIERDEDIEEEIFEIGDLVLVSGKYEAIIISWNDDGTATVQSESTGKKYNVEPECIERPNNRLQATGQSAPRA